MSAAVGTAGSVPRGGNAHASGYGAGRGSAVAGHDAAAHDPESRRIVTAYGFWIFLISDIILFAAFFAAYAVLTDATAGGPRGKDLFDTTSVAIETACLLTSSFTCGLAGLAWQARHRPIFYTAMTATFVLGAAFLAIEVHEFAGMVGANAGPTRSAFLSAFFALIGCHGLHVTAGLLFLLTMMAQLAAKGFRDDVGRRMLCFSLFWHTLDIIWVALFSLVYLVGVSR
jgi:cytochrome o ubiquinol oxidase subunit 3